MQNCLEVIADAVLQVVLYQVEADENESYLINPDASPLLRGVSLLIDLAKQKAKQWSETEEKHNEEIMLDYCKELYDSTLNISTFLQKLTNDAYDQNTKEELLFACKNSMVTTIKLMQIADYYDIRKVEKAANASKRDLARILNANFQTLNEDVRVFIYSTVTLAKEISFRSEYIKDSLSVLSDQLLETNKVLTSDPENIIKLTAYLIQEPSDGLARDQRDILELKLLESIDNVVEITRESSRRLFDGLLLDLTPIDRNKYILKNLGSIASFDLVISKMDEALEQLALDSYRAKSEAAFTANMLEDMKKMNSYVVSLRNSVRLKVDEEDSPHRKEAILRSLQVLEDALRSVILDLKPALENPADDALISNLMLSIEKCRMACDHLQKSINGNEEYDLLNESASNVQKALENLRNAIAFGDKSEIINNTKEAVNGLRSQIENIAIISPSIMSLVEGSKSLLSSQSNDDQSSALRKLNFIIDECEDVAQYNQNNTTPAVYQTLDYLKKLDNLLLALNDREITPDFADHQINDRILPSLLRISSRKQNDDNNNNDSNNNDNNNKIANAINDLSSITNHFVAQLNQSNEMVDRASIFKEEYPRFKNSIMKVADMSLNDKEEAILHNTTILHYQAQKMKENILKGDAQLLSHLNKQTRERLERQILIAEMIESQKPTHDFNHEQHSSSSSSPLSKMVNDYKDLANQLTDLSTQHNNDHHHHHHDNSFSRTKKACDQILNLNHEILKMNIDPRRASMRMNELNIEVEANIEEISNFSKSTPRYSSLEIRPNLINIAESLQQQELLASIVKADESISPSNQKLIDQSIQNISNSIQKVYTASADAFDQNDIASKNRLKKILDDALIQSELLTSAVQTSLLHRIEENSQQLYHQINLLLNPSTSFSSSDDFNFEKQKFIKRYEKQLALCKKVSLCCNNQSLKVPFIKLLDHGMKSIDNYKTIESPELANKLLMNLGTINQHLTRLSRETVNENPNLTINNLNDVANQIENFSNSLEIQNDGSPKGRLSSVVSSVASQLKRMSDGVTLHNKRDFIDSSKSISQIVSDILIIAREILKLFPNAKQHVKSEMMEMAHASKNFSVQLKILAAVKSSSSQDDPTTETQLLTCAKGLSNSLIQIVNSLQVLELTSAINQF